jgi:outer membrane protein TolC
MCLVLIVSLGGMRCGLAEAGEVTWSSLKLQLTAPQGGPIEAPPVPLAGVMPLSIQDAIALALKGNLDIQVEGFNPELRQQELTSEKAVFDPSAFLETSFSDNRVPTSLNVLLAQPSLSDQFNLNAGLRQRLPLGGTYEVRFDNQWANLRNVDRSGVLSGLSLNLTMPLLKNFGLEANETGILLATNNQSISKEQLRLRVSDIVTQVQNAYVDFAFTLENVEVQRRSLRLAQDLVTLNKARVRAGVAAPVEVTQAEAQEAARVQDVILAEKAVQDAEDTLRVIMNLPASGSWGQELKPTYTLSFEPKVVNLADSLQKAMGNRNELKGAKLDIDNKQLSARLARNQLLPDLNLNGSVSTNGFGGSYGSDMSAMWSGDFVSYSVGVVLTVPLGNRGPQANYTKATLVEGQAKTSLRQLELQITQQVREAVRRVEANAKRVDANRAARVLAEEQLRVETRRLEAGVSTTFNVLSFQRDLAAAQATEIRSIADYFQSLANLEKVQGTVLEANRIQM